MAACKDSFTEPGTDLGSTFMKRPPSASGAKILYAIGMSSPSNRVCITPVSVEYGWKMWCLLQKLDAGILSKSPRFLKFSYGHIYTARSLGGVSNACSVLGSSRLHPDATKGKYGVW